MRAIDRIALIDKIGRALQSRFWYDEINTFLGTYGIDPPRDVTTNSKWVYSKTALRNAQEVTLLRVAEELDIAPEAHGARPQIAPENWRDTAMFKLFISHISKDKVTATRLSATLKPYGISGFVAHEDIHPTLEWQREIERALLTMDAFLAIHTKGFHESNWTQQEVGFAVGRGVKIISFKMGEDPTGFISKQQALPRLNRTAEQIAEEIDKLLAADPVTAEKLLSAKAASKKPADNMPF